ncbi:MAG: MoxR-like ATPase [Myxococcales bacterium]|nr:MoxR-like ATPase [Myxococcales bacterium]
MKKLAWLALALAMGCAQENAPRSYVQPNVIKKADLQGTWYYLQTVTDAPPTSAIMFIGQSSELMKIRFDVQEGFLYARRAYEQVADSEDAYKQDPAKYAGQPLAAWPIKNQFDIIRDYNSTTGEESNKIIESTERPWNEREFIRVDWSENQITDYVGIGLNFFFNDATVSNVSYWESDPTKPDALHFERAVKPVDETAEFGEGEANYFDITNKLAVNPTERQICYEQGGVQQCFNVPACFLRQQLDDCATQVVKVRHAFAKVSPKHDYQPRNWDGQQMNLFGIWDVGLNRLTYNRQYGVTNTGIRRHAARFNIWQKSYQADGKTPIPYDKRQLRTIPYYAESSLEPFPPELFDSGKEVIKQWNEAVKCAAADVMGFQKADKQCDITKVPDIFVWCHNPIKAGDPDACKADLKPQLDAQGNVVVGDDGQPILRARQGDPRRSTIFWVNQTQSAGPLGYGPPLFDIETGETISGQAYIYGAGVDSYAARSRDLVALMLGQQSPDDFVVGTNIKDWVQSNRAGTTNLPTTLSDDQVKKMYSAMDFSWARGQAPEAPIDRSSPTAFMTSWENRENAMYRSNLFGQSQADLPQVRRDKLRGTVLESMMITPDIMAMGGGAPATDWTSLSEAEKARVSPLRSQAVRKEINDRMDKMRAFGVDFADFADEGIAQRALQLANDPAVPNMDPEAIRQKLRKDIFLSVTLHEAGHNMGLRHNFRASFDAMNYFPEYWDLRAAAAKNPAAKKFAGIDTATQQPIGVAYAGADCNAAARKNTMRPRYVDCPGGATSVDEVVGNVREYQYSSVMDYGSNFNSDLWGLGRYDKAAMKFSYAGDGFVEVFPSAKQDQNTQLLWAAIHAFQNSLGLPSPIGLTAGLSSINYTTYPSLFFDGVTGMANRVDVPYSDITPGGPGGYVLSDTLNRPLVPYFFCSDEFVGNLTCQRFDSGADAFEQAQDIISRYKNYYLLNNFKRDRYTFHTNLAYKDNISSRYLDMLRQQLTWYVLLRADFTDFEAAQADPNPGAAVDSFFNNEDGWATFTAAVSAGFDLIGQIITQPEAGNFVKVSANVVSDYPVDVWKKNSDGTQPQIGGPPGAKIIGLIDGKYIDTTWDFRGCGYYWADECQTRIGYFVDKTIALDILSQSQAYFTGRDTSTDVRKYAIGYALPFKAQVQEKIGALLAGDFSTFAPYFTGAAADKVTNPGWSLNSSNIAARPASPELIDPAGGFTLQLYAGLYGLSAFPTTFDHSFVDSTRVFVVGNGEAPIPDSQLLNSNGTPGPKATTNPAQLVSNSPTPGTFEWFIFTDPTSGKTYAAQATKRVADGSAGAVPTTAQMYRNDTGVRMLETALQLQTQATALCPGSDAAGQAACAAKTQALQKFKQNIDVMRSLHNAFGYASYKTDAPFYY